MNTYLAGNLIRVATYTGGIDAPDGGFRDQDGNLADPDEVTLTYRPGPSSPVIMVTFPDAPVIRDATGLYHADLDTTAAAVSATWTYEWSGSGSVQAAASGAFLITVPFL